MSLSPALQRAREQLAEQLTRLGELRNASTRDSGFKQWRQSTLTLIQRLWPADSGKSERFRRVPFSSPSNRMSPQATREFYERGCAEAAACLKSLIAELDRSGLPESAPAAKGSVPVPPVGEDDFPLIDLGSKQDEIGVTPVGEPLFDLSELPGPDDPPPQVPQPAAETPMPFDEPVPPVTPAAETTSPPVGHADLEEGPPQAATAQVPDAPAAGAPPPVSEGKITLRSARPPKNDGNKRPLKEMLGFVDPPATSSAAPQGMHQSSMGPPLPARVAGVESQVGVAPPLGSEPTSPAETEFTPPTGEPQEDAAHAPAAPEDSFAGPVHEEEPLIDFLTAPREKSAEATQDDDLGPPPEWSAIATDQDSGGEFYEEMVVDPFDYPGADAASVSPSSAHDLRAEPSPSPVRKSLSPWPTAIRPQQGSVAGAGTLPPVSPEQAHDHERASTPSDAESADPADATAEFLRTSPVLKAHARPVKRTQPAPPPAPSISPVAASLHALASEVASLGVPEGQRAGARAALLDLARQVDERTLTWDSLRLAVGFVMDHPELARRVLPLLIPYLEAAA